MIMNLFEKKKRGLDLMPIDRARVIKIDMLACGQSLVRVEERITNLTEVTAMPWVRIELAITKSKWFI